MAGTGSLLRALDCRACGATLAPDFVVGPCPSCGHTLLARYDLDRLDGARWFRSLGERPPGLWRYRELLPVRDAAFITGWGEGSTALLPLGPVETAPGVEVLVKDDGGLPTGSFKARGMAAAVSRARELGLTELYVPSAGNAGIALAAYTARAGLRGRVYLPESTPRAAKEACALYGAEVIEVPGTIREAGTAARERERGRGSFDVSTLREPYRVEGKKTMGLEIVEASAPGALPDAIVYPTGGGTGLVGMAKAFRELRSLGLLDRSPRLYAVQPEHCAPVVRALRDGATRITPWEDPRTIAPGLLVPAPFASERVLEAVRETGGAGATVTDRELLDAMRSLARHHGLSVSPEAAAPYAALPRLLADGRIRPGESVVLYHTGTGIPFSADRLEQEIAPPPR